MNTARLNQGTPLLLNGVTKRYGDNTIQEYPAASFSRAGSAKQR